MGIRLGVRVRVRVTVGFRIKVRIRFRVFCSSVRSGNRKIRESNSG